MAKCVGGCHSWQVETESLLVVEFAAALLGRWNDRSPVSQHPPSGSVRTKLMRDQREDTGMHAPPGLELLNVMQRRPPEVVNYVLVRNATK